MKRWLQSEPGIAITALLTGILILVPIKVENRQIQWANQWASWTGFGQDEEITVTDKFANPQCEGTDPKCQIQERTRVRKIVSGKTLWDVLSLLGVPFALAVLGFWLQQVQQKRADEDVKREREQAEEAAKEEVLQAYFDRIAELLIRERVIAIAVKQDKAADNPSAEPVSDEQKELVDAARDVIRARTLSILRRLGSDGERKGSVIRFLIETEIIGKLKLDLSSADLSSADLSSADLSSSKLISANLNGANLSEANFREANLRSANLNGANLNSANFSQANLRNANLSYTNLIDADLVRVNLRNTNLSTANLSTAKLTYADLNSANLSNTKISHADLNGTNLSKSNLSGAFLLNTLLIGADLSHADLSSTKFFSAILNDSNFSRAIVLKTDLSTAKQLTQKQLEGGLSPYICKVKLPSGITIDPNRDCKQLPQILKYRYPERFKTIEEAQRYIGSL